MKIIAFLLCLLSISCLEARDINTKPIKLQCIRFFYNFPGRGDIHIAYCNDEENGLCYAVIGDGPIQVVDFKNCYDLFADFGNKAEKE